MMGVSPKPDTVKVNGQDVNFTFNNKTGVSNVL